MDTMQLPLFIEGFRDQDGDMTFGFMFGQYVAPEWATATYARAASKIDGCDKDATNAVIKIAAEIVEDALYEMDYDLFSKELFWIFESEAKRRAFDVSADVYASVCVEILSVMCEAKKAQ